MTRMIRNAAQGISLAVACAAVSGSAEAQARPAQPETGGFVVTLGSDTISAESFTRSGDRVEGIVARRIPRTVVVRYTMTLARSGLASRLEYNTRLPDGAMLPNGARTIIVNFTRDSVFTEIVRDTGTTRRRVAARDAFPELDGAVSLYRLPIAALEASDADSATFASYVPGASSAEPMPVASRGRGSRRYWVYTFGNPTEVLTDAGGRVLSVDGSRTTVKIQSRRQNTVDVAVIAAAFAARERAAGALTALSPRDSVVTTLGSARIAIDYGRPSARGRRIFGPNGVLGDTIWRTGANASTKFRTDAAINIGGQVLAPGEYVLTTLAIPGRYHLIFSANDREVLRVPLTATPRSEPLERFTISIVQAGELRLAWDTLELSAPIRAP